MYCDQGSKVLSSCQNVNIIDVFFDLLLNLGEDEVPLASCSHIQDYIRSTLLQVHAVCMSIVSMLSSAQEKVRPKDWFIGDSWRKIIVGNTEIDAYNII